jgi:hypothetical protein
MRSLRRPTAVAGSSDFDLHRERIAANARPQLTPPSDLQGLRRREQDAALADVQQLNRGRGSQRNLELRPGHRRPWAAPTLVEGLGHR